MFCKNCGSNIQDGTKFCPKCGKAAAGGESKSGASGAWGIVKTGNDSGSFQDGRAGSGSFSFAGAGDVFGISGGSAVQKKAGSRKNLWIILAAAVAAAAVLAFWYYNATREYSIVGEWESVDLLDLAEMLNSDEMSVAMEEEGLSQTQMNMLRDAFSAVQGVADNVSLVFYERGEFAISVGGVSSGVRFSKSTYEQMPNGRLNLNFDWDISLEGLGKLRVFENLLPDGISYNTKCRVRKNTMTLELFGQKLKFRRK